MGIEFAYLLGFTITFCFVMYKELRDMANPYPHTQGIFWNCIFLALVFPVTWFMWILWEAMEWIDEQEER